MVHPSTRSTRLFALVGVVAAACGGGSNVSNASPRIAEIPQQSIPGDDTFSLDLADYVTDRENAPLTFAATSGGGSFAGSVYSQTFATMGVYTIGFTASDGSKTTEGSFEVRVSEAELVVVREDTSGLLLLDSRTNQFVRVAGSAATPNFAAGLGDGRLVYQIAGSAGSQLWIFDPLARKTTRVAAAAGGDVTYRAKTSDNRIVYTAGTASEMTIFLHSPMTGVSREINQGAGSTLTVAVNVNDLVFYEVSDGGQSDVYYYDPGEDQSFAVGTATTDEQIQALLPDGAVVFTRVGGGGEADLWYFKVGTGLVEIGSDVANIATDNKVYGGFGAQSQVVFAAQSGGVSDIHAWNPADGQTTSLSAAFGAGANDEFVAVGAGNEVVFHRVVSASEVDAYFYDLDSGTSATVRNGSDTSTVLAVTGDGTTAWAIVSATGAPSSLFAVSLVGTPATQTYAAAGTVAASVGVLADGDAVAQLADGTALNVFDVAAGSWGTPITGTGLSFAGDGLAAGDFVYSSTAAAQTDLSMWRAATTDSAVISIVAGDDVFSVLTSSGTVLFTRVGVGGNADLFAWDGSVATQLTAADEVGLLHDHTTVGKYSGAR